jgi:uncharacterized membrane protein
VSDTSQGPGWWQASDGKWYPPEQAPGYQAPASAGGPAPASTPTGGGIGDAFNYGWLKFQQNVGPILIVAAIGLVVLIVVTAIWFFGIFGLASASTSCHTDVNGFTSCHSSGGGFLATLLVGAVFALLIFFVLMMWQMALIRGSLMIVNGEGLEVNKMFGTDQIGSYAIAAILVAVGTAIGSFFCYIPGLIFFFFAQWFGWFVIAKGMSPIDSIKASFSFVNKNLATLIGFVICCWIAVALGYLVCLVGLLVALPVVVIAQGYMFRRLQGEPVAA